jgi:hypothetical protein
LTIKDDYKNYELSLYDIKKLKKFFYQNKVIAYGNGSFYVRIKEFLTKFNLEFVDVFYTKDSQIVTISGGNYKDEIKDSSILICSSFYTEIIKLINQEIIQPKSIKIATFSDDSGKFFTQYMKYNISKIRLKHETILKGLKKKDKIRVLFLAIHKSVWKVDSVFTKMLEDSYFEPIVLICPYTSYGEERMYEDLKESYQYFKEKGYPVISSYDENNDSWIQLNELKPDIVFFTNPHNLTKKEYYHDAYTNYLSCYVPYFYLMTAHDDNQTIYNKIFHNLIWKIFLPHQDSLKYTKKIAINKGKNALVTGYPFSENLLDKNTQIPIWKNQEKDKIKIIYAPHHSIDDDKELNLSTFLKYGEFFQKISIELKDKTQWCFKPHPLLKSKLYLHPHWGNKKTDEYYDYWEHNSNTQLEDGEYIDLFKQSDCMIHDSGSFLVEYLFTANPVMYLMTNKTKSNLNSFGLQALECCDQAYSEKDIINFIYKLISSQPLDQNHKKKFINQHINDFFDQSLPSERIISHIKQSIKE